MRYRVRFSAGATADLELRMRFLAAKDKAAARRARAAIGNAMITLRSFPFSCRKADSESTPSLRELVIPFGRDGYVLLFEITEPKTVTILAVRHQREDDEFI